MKNSSKYLKKGKIKKTIYIKNKLNKYYYMKKKYILLTGLLIITLLNGCGYKPVYSSKDFYLKLDEITHDN